MDVKIMMMILNSNNNGEETSSWREMFTPYLLSRIDVMFCLHLQG